MKGFTLIDAIIGIFIVLVVFLGVFGAYELGLKVVAQSKNRITATALANQEMERIRNLPYGSIGTVGASLPFAEGDLEPSTTTERNGVEYLVERRIEYVSDAADNPESCNWDYKRAQIKVSWSGRLSGYVKLDTDIVPKNTAEESAACSSQPGGILSVSVYDALGAAVPSPLIEIINPATSEVVASKTPESGEYDFPLATSTYKVAVSKPGYSSDESFAAGDDYGGRVIASPFHSNLSVFENQITESSFSIDKASSFSVSTFSAWGSDEFSDSFFDAAKIYDSSDVDVGGGQIVLATTTSGYLPSGYAVSTSTEPSDILRWDKFAWSDTEPLGTELKYRVFYATSSAWSAVPDSDLPGNGSGFGVSPVDLSGLDKTAYPKLRAKALFSSSDGSATPFLYDWSISWITSEAVSVPNIQFNLRGSKIVGTDSSEESIYKYSQSLSSGSGGQVAVSDLEWDSYIFSIDASSGLSLSAIDPSPQPITLNPDVSMKQVKLYLEAQNSLLVSVRNKDTLEPVFGASVRMYNAGLSYDETQYTNADGQTFFIPLEEAVYNLEIGASGYSSTSTAASVSGDSAETFSLEQVE